jgi:radical SAM superfamily enzyme YgiQ (UPF0313 family)
MASYRLQLIKPAELVNGEPVKLEKALTPTRALPYLAALTPDTFDVAITDDSLDEIDYDAKVDLVGITTLISQVPRAIQIADRFRARGVKVIMGGVGASAVPDLVLPHVDSLVIGEAEPVWGGVLADFAAGRLQHRYQAAAFCAMDNLPVPRFDLLKTSAFVRPGRAISKSALPRIPIETSRGCPHGCAFCSVTKYFGRTMRFRPIEQVIAEMRRFPGAYFFLVDDNIGADRPRAKELFRAMIPLKNRWIGQFSSLAAADPELLDLARQSGCINAFVGVESFHSGSLNSVGKRHNVGRDFGTMLAAFRSAGIDLNVSLIVGFDTDTPQTIRETTDIAIALKVHLMTLFILTPIPGTELHAQFDREGRILHRDYSLYDGTHAVFRPRNMEAAELEALYWESFARFYSVGNIARRFSNVVRWPLKHPLTPVLYTGMGNRFYRKTIQQRMHPLCGGNGVRAPLAHRADPQTGSLR